MRADYIPEPTVVMLGCRPWPPPPRPDGSCGVCGHGIRSDHHGYFCGWSDEGTPGFEVRVRNARLGLRSRSRAQESDATARAGLERKSGKGAIVLTEAERRRYWHGRGIPGDGVTNPASIGRQWLESIGQPPDFDIILDRRGRKVGRHSESDHAQSESVQGRPDHD